MDPRSLAGVLFFGYHQIRLPWFIDNPARMNSYRMRHHRRNALIGILLALSLLLTQWLGYAHAIAHAGGLAEFTKVIQTGGAFEHAKSASACAEFDAATLGAGTLNSSLPVWQAVQESGPVILPLRSGWHRQFSAHFSSRAPPLNA